MKVWLNTQATKYRQPYAYTSMHLLTPLAFSENWTA